MIKRLDKSELIFKVISYFLLTVFALFCLYPFVYSISCAISGKAAMTSGSIILWPVYPQFNAFLYCFTMSEFWLCYANTLFLTAFGTIISLFVSILGAYEI